MQYYKSYKFPVVLLSAAFSAGILSARLFPIYPAVLWFSVCLVLFCLFLTPRFRTHVRSAIFILLFCACGAIHYHLIADLLAKEHIHKSPWSRVIAVEGIIADYHYRHDGKDKYLLELERVFTDSSTSNASGQILLKTHKLNRRFGYGDRIHISGSLEKARPIRNPGQFDYQSYLADQDIYFIMKIQTSTKVQLLDVKQGNLFIQNLIIPIRHYIVQSLAGSLNKKSNAIIKALILGEKQDLNPEIVAAFQRVGVVHVLAISGLHVGFIITFVFSVVSLLRFNRIQKIWILIIVLIIYIILVRFKVPVIRSATMAIFYLFGKILERRVSIYNVIFTAMLLILFLDPRELFRPGFQFSFAAVLSIIYGYQKLNQRLPLQRFFASRLRKKKWMHFFLKIIWGPLLVSISAVMGTAPLALYYYGQFPTYAVVANLVVIPLIGLMVFSSIFMLIFSFFSTFFASGMGQIITYTFEFLELFVHYLSEVPGATIFFPFPTISQTIIIFIAIILIINMKFDRRSLIRSALLFLVIFVSFVSLISERDLEIAFLDVGQGDAIFIRFPNQKTTLIDAGNSSRYWDDGQKTIQPFLQQAATKRINYLIGSHPHHDHIGGFAYLLDNIKIDTLVLTGYQYRSRLYQKIRKSAERKMIPIKQVIRGDQLKIDPACRIYILHPDSAFCVAETHQGDECNNSSIVMKVQYGVNGILLTGDLERTGELPVLDYGHFLESEILKVGHHGSITSTSSAFLNHINPLLAVISVGRNNKFKHPSPKTLERLRQKAIKTYLTSKHGAIIFRLGPETIRKVAWRKSSF